MNRDHRKNSDLCFVYFFMDKKKEKEIKFTELKFNISFSHIDLKNHLILNSGLFEYLREAKKRQITKQ